MAFLSTRSTTLLVSFAVGSSGCATGAALAPRVATPAPAGWGNTAQGIVAASEDLTRWWDRLGDAALTRIIDRSLQNNPDMRTAQARLRQARAQRNVTGADLLPAVSGSASATLRDSEPSVNAGFDASWEPDIFGGASAAVDAATADVRASLADLNATQVSLAAEVARTYVDLRRGQARLEIALANARSQAETLELTEFRQMAGLVSSLDVEQARSNVLQTRAQIPSLESSIAQTIHRLSTLAGLEPYALAPELSVAAPLPEIPAQVAVGIPAETLRQRPDVQAAELRIIAESARLVQAEKQRYPRFSLSGSIGAEVLTGALTGGTSFVSSLAGSVIQTIFDGGRIRQQIVIQSAAEEQAVAAYDATMLAALEDVENALVAFEKSRQRLVELEAAATAARDAALLARSQYSAGLSDFQAVLDADRTVRSVEDSVAETQGDRLTALVQLYKALGGGWSPRAVGSGLVGSGNE